MADTRSAIPQLDARLDAKPWSEPERRSGAVLADELADPLKESRPTLATRVTRAFGIPGFSRLAWHRSA